MSQQQQQPLVYSQVLPVQSFVQPVPQQTLFSSQVIAGSGQQVSQSIRGESRIEYYPIERRTIEYETQERVITEQVPRVITQYETVEKKYIEQIPREKVWTEYEAVEYQKEYIPRTIYETVQEQVPVTRVEYIPVQRTEYVAQERTDYISQSRQVPRVEYDEVEYQVQRPQQQYQYQQQQLVGSQVVSRPLQGSQVIYTSQPQIISSQFVQQPVLRASQQMQ
ncbi:hypothetical protein PPERSA_02511 [Pseudocohnilembus persalinus]|uniref:Uncharacterized protein n=1 Tax=Pseudocohnilembus persalinus TaxID=266149 RepID=A0A0V0QBE0_PSEPJ|nr:hypothetical protein PPERSA_02511 [Pseudocohnilembus persalinus]|eukprot:KRW99399.1 hypothetical protein PPERSA_02511 [Pseudocohnilembus persalinus]